MEVKFLARVRKLLEAIDSASPDTPNVVTLTQQLELLIAQSAAPYQEIVRTGRALWTGTTAALAAVVATPTTGVMLALYNADADGGRSLIIDWVAASGVAKTAAAGQAQLLGLVGQVREAVPADAGLTLKKMNGNGNIKGTVDSPATTQTAALPANTGIAANWFPLRESTGFPGAAATPGHGLYAPVDGRIVVAPGRYFAMHVLADVVGSTFLGYIGFHSKQLQLG